LALDTFIRFPYNSEMSKQQFRDILEVLKQLHAIRRPDFDINDDGKAAFARLDPQWASEMAEINLFWRRFKIRCSKCGK